MIGRTYAHAAGFANAHSENVTPAGDKLTFVLQTADDTFLAKLASPFMCARLQGAGGEDTLSAGPYFVSSHVAGKSILLRRNRFYRGTRPQGV